MSQIVKLKRSAVPNKVPTTADLELGELAINTYDGKLYFEKDDGTSSIISVANTSDLATKQDALISGTNIKTISGNSLLGEGNIEIAGSFGITIDGSGSAITSGMKGYVTVPYNCTIQSWSIIADAAGSITIDLWKSNYAAYPPTNTNSITGTEKPSLSSSIKNQDISLDSWVKSVSAGDIVAFYVESASAVTKVQLTINTVRV